MHYDLATDTLRYSNGAAVPDESAISAELRRRGAIRPPTAAIPGDHVHLAHRSRVLDDLIAAAVTAPPLPDTPASDPELRIDLLAATLPNLRSLHARALLYATVLNTYPPAWWFEHFAIVTALSCPPALLQAATRHTKRRSPRDLQAQYASARALELVGQYDGDQLTRRANLFSGVGWLLEGRMDVVRGRVRTVTVEVREKAVAGGSAVRRAAHATRTVELVWTCPVCQGPRGEPRIAPGAASSPAAAQSWDNPCGHIDDGVEILAEADRLASAGLPEPVPLA